MDVPAESGAVSGGWNPGSSGPRRSCGCSPWQQTRQQPPDRFARLGFCDELPDHAQLLAGGFKHSGYGEDLSVYGLEDYTCIKHVMHNIEF